MFRRPYQPFGKTFKKKKYPNKRRLPSRAQGNLTKKVQINRLITKQLKNVVETKVHGMITFTEQVPNSPVVGAQGQVAYFCIGDSAPSAWTGTWNALGSIPDTVGTGSQHRISDYVFLKKSTLNMSIDMNTDTQQGTPYAPWEFRVICGKVNRKYSPAGITPNPNTDLLLSPSGAGRGFGTSGVAAPNLMMSPTNRRDFTILSDRRFVMESPHSTQANSTGVYPATRTMQFSLPHWKKVHFDNSGNITNYDPQYFVIVYARPVGHDGSASRWEVNAQGSTTYNDS